MKTITTIIIIMLGGGQFPVLGQVKSNSGERTGKLHTIGKFEIPAYDSELIIQEDSKWKCQPINADKKGFGRWGLLLLLVAVGGAVAGGVYAATIDNDNRALPLLPRGPLKGKFRN